MREIKISINAQKKTKILLEYLEAKWSERIRIKFAKKLYDSLQIIRVNPEIFPKSETNKKYKTMSLPDKRHCFILLQAKEYM